MMGILRHETLCFIDKEIKDIQHPQESIKTCTCAKLEAKVVNEMKDAFILHER